MALRLAPRSGYLGCNLRMYVTNTQTKERRPSSGTRAGVSDSPRKHIGHVPVHLWQRAWFMARDLGIRGETRLHHRPGLILTPVVPHNWALPGLHQVCFYRSALLS
jgi:hypothetical protein